MKKTKKQTKKKTKKMTKENPDLFESYDTFSNQDLEELIETFRKEADKIEELLNDRFDKIIKKKMADAVAKQKYHN